MLKIHAIFNDIDIAEQSTFQTKPEYDVLSEKSERRLYWYKGYGEPPVRALLNPPLIEEDLDDVELTKEYNCTLFDMSNEEHEHLYKCVKDRVYSGWYSVIKEESHWEGGRMLIWLEWLQNYYDFNNSQMQGDYE